MSHFDVMSHFDLAKWNAKYSGRENAPHEPSRVLVDLRWHLPHSGTALDVAGGAGRHAIYLASRGLSTTLWDISSVGLTLAKERALEVGVRLAALQIDLDKIAALPGGRFDLVLNVCYLNRPLLANSHNLLNTGGTLIVIQPTRRNLERHAKPPSAFLLEEGELCQLVAPLQIVHYEEAWSLDGRHDAVLVAKRG